jgi:hypothetical protein
MNQRLEVSKLAQLRAKTDRQLVQVINSSIDAGLQSARRTGSLLQAEKAREQVDRLLPLVSVRERRALESKLVRLDQELKTRTRTRILAAS